MLAYLIRVLCLAALLVLQSCASSVSSHTTQAKPGYAPIPGGDWMYWFGDGQTYANFENVEIAQSYYGIWPEVRNWSRLTPSQWATGTKSLQAYYPLHVRWKLKDGREFILENIDVAAIMREYFNNHSLQLQWQRENRKKAVGDGSATLAHGVKDDTVILKWVIPINRTPVNKRLTTSGVAPKWDLHYEEHIVTTLKGNPASGIDFSKTRERFPEKRPTSIVE